MGNKVNSTDYNLQVRDLSNEMNMVLQKNPIFTSLIGTEGEATNTKHEWIEDVVTPKSWKVNGAYTAGGGTFTLDSTAGLKEGDVLKFTESTGASVDMQVKVTNVVDSTTINVSEFNGSENVGDNAVVGLVSRAKAEATVAEADNGYEPTTKFNYTQIFDRTAKVSKTAEAIKMYGIDETLNYQVMRQLQDLQYEIINSVISGIKEERTASNAGRLGGIINLMKEANASGSNNVIDAANGALSTTIMNNAFEQGTSNGATNMTTILCHPTQARKISAFNTSGDNPVVTRDDTRAGNYVMEYVSDLPIAGGLIGKIVVDRNFPQDKIAILDVEKINWIPLTGRGFNQEEATPAGADYYARRILGEYTLEMKNAGEAHILIENLAI